MRVTLLFYIICLSVLFGYTQPQKISLFSESIPCESNIALSLRYDFERKMIVEVELPEMWFFPAENSNEKSAAVLIIPGGGYGGLSYEREGNQVASWLNSLGISAFVLIHRLPSPAYGYCQNSVPLTDAKRAIELIRENADIWKIDSSQIGVMGFSAGGHLAATLSTKYSDKYDDSVNTTKDYNARPDFTILIYPVITMSLPETHYGSRKNLLGENPSNDDVMLFSNENHVTPNTPPTLLIHAGDDKAVVVENSIKYFSALQSNAVPSAMHIWEKGGHGFGMRGGEGAIKSWPVVAEDWLIQREIISNIFKDKATGSPVLHF